MDNLNYYNNYTFVNYFVKLIIHPPQKIHFIPNSLLKTLAHFLLFPSNFILRISQKLCITLKR